MPDNDCLHDPFPGGVPRGGKTPRGPSGIRSREHGPRGVKAALADQSDLTYGGLVRDTYTAKEEATASGSARSATSRQRCRGGSPSPVGSVRETFNSGGGTQHITQSRETIACYPGEDFPVLMDNTRGAIGVTLEGEVQGCDVVTPAYNFTRRKVFLPARSRMNTRA